MVLAVLVSNWNMGDYYSINLSGVLGQILIIKYAYVLHYHINQIYYYFHLLQTSVK